MPVQDDAHKITALPSIQDLAERVGPSLRKYNPGPLPAAGAELPQEATTAGEVAALIAPVLSEQLFRLLGEAIEDVREDSPPSRC